jgi:hypothetical protein
MAGSAGLIQVDESPIRVITYLIGRAQPGWAGWWGTTKLAYQIKGANGMYNATMSAFYVTRSAGPKDPVGGGVAGGGGGGRACRGRCRSAEGRRSWSIPGWE